MARGACTLLAVTLGLVSPAGEAQVLPVFKVSSDLVVVDLTASDRSGRVVTDLQPSEIRILEDGKPRTVQFVKLVHHGTEVREAGAQATKPPAASGGDAAPRTDNSSSDVRVGIVVDLGSTPLEALPRLRDHVLQSLRGGMPDGILVMVATIGPQVEIRQAFTADRNVVINAVEALHTMPIARTTFADVLDRVDQLCAAARPGTLIDWAIASGKDVIVEANQRVVESSLALSMLAQSLAALPGRKHIVFYSTGYPVDPVNQVIDAVVAGVAACTGMDMLAVRRRVAGELGALSSRAAADALRMVVDRANRAQVSFYVVDVRGLMTTTVQAQHRGLSRTGGSGAPVKLPGLTETLTRDYLNMLATDTGGRTFFDTNDIGIGLRQAWQDADSYYLIGYRPASSRKRGRFRKIEVQIRRPDLSLRYRRAYYDATERELAEADIDNALRVPGAFDREGFDVWTVVEGRMLGIEVRVPTAAIRLTPTGDLHSGDFSVHAELRNHTGALVGGKPIPGRDIAVRLDSDHLRAFQSSDKLAVHLETPVPKPGTYVLAVVARDSSGWIAVRTIEVRLAQ